MKQKPSIILGIDPGIKVTGYAIIQREGSHWQPLDFGCIRPPRISKKSHLGSRCLVIFEGINQIIEQFHPQVISIESPFVSKNIQVALTLGKVQGVVLIAAAQHGIEVFSYSPKKAKLAVSGQGTANKYQVQRMMQYHFKLDKLPDPPDAADALALALCHAHTLP